VLLTSSLPDRFYGFDFKGLNWRISDYVWERDSTYSIMRSYGMNMIRRHFAGEPVYSNTEAYMSRLERCATLAAERQMWVIFDLYSWDLGTAPEIRRQQESNWNPASSTWSDARWNQLWTNMGNRFKDHPNVILELGNEPDTDGIAANYNTTRDRYAATITLLRNLGFTNYIGIPGLDYGTTPLPWVTRYSTLSAADTLDKFFFFIHYYQYWQGGSGTQSGIRNYLNARGCDDLMAAGFRVMVGEFGVKGREAQQTSAERTWFQNFLLVQRDDGYDSCFQSFQPGADFPGIQGDWGDDYWPARTPTTPFRYFYQGWGTTYGGVPDDLEYYSDLPLDNGTLTVTAGYQNGTPVGAQIQVTSGTQSYFGLSGYPRTLGGTYSTNIIDDIITEMNQNNLNIYRMSIWYTVNDSTRDEMAQYFLENCGYDLIVCYHDYPAGAMPSWATAQAWTLDLLDTFSDYQDRLWVEFENERTDADLANQSQTIVTAVRNAGYTAKLIANKWNQSWSSMAGVTDPLDKFYTGYHYYFNSWSVSGATSDMSQAMSAGIPGIRLINTEIGADSNEKGSFSSGEVAEVNQFMAWGADRGIGNMVWMNRGLDNWITYEGMNLTFPAYSVIYQGQTPINQLSLDAGVYNLAAVWENTTQTRTTTIASSHSQTPRFPRKSMRSRYDCSAARVDTPCRMQGCIRC
jgi:hypothetical protein